MFTIRFTKQCIPQRLIHKVSLLLFWCVTVLGGQSAFAQRPADRPGLFYAVTGNGLKDTSWLFGTHHLLKSSYIDAQTAIKAAFNRSKGVVVEIEVDPVTLQAAQAKGMMQSSTLRGLLSEPFADSLNAELKSTLGMELQSMNQLKPMAIITALTMMYTMRDNAGTIAQYTGEPMDLAFVTTGKQAGKTIHPLETIDAQMDVLFNSLTDAEQAVQLQYFLRNKEEGIRLGNALLRDWLNQDATAMQAVFEKTRSLYPPTGTDFYALINEARNDQWMQQLPGLLQQGSKFVAVGAMHLLGPSGLVNQLRKSGYTVIPVK
jgi:uncharacterized protein